MNATIERVARAMCLADGFDPDSDIRQLKSGVVLQITINGPPERWRTYTTRARAAIKAMRIPSTAAVNAGGQFFVEGDTTALDVWTTMIDADIMDDDGTNERERRGLPAVSNHSQPRPRAGSAS